MMLPPAREEEYGTEHLGRIGGFSLHAGVWVLGFVRWYNTEHRHSAIKFVTPNQRHSGQDVEILENRKRVYAAAKERNPNRWSGETRNWERPEKVWLNPDKEDPPATEKLKEVA
ncbi:MAG: putative transposase [Granulosicoccus sp.]|jgi:hypothetical protein